MRRINAEAAASGASAKKVKLNDGSEVPVGAAKKLLRDFLQDRGKEASLREILDGTKLDLRKENPSGAELLDSLREGNPLIEVREEGGAEPRLAYQPRYGVGGPADLARLVERALPGGGGVEESLHRTTLESDTYDGVTLDLDMLLAEGRCVPLVDTGSKERIVYAHPDSKEPVAPVCVRVRELWRRVALPQEEELRKQLVKRKLRSAEELEARERRRAEGEQRLRDAREPPKKRRRAVGNPC